MRWEKKSARSKDSYPIQNHDLSVKALKKILGRHTEIQINRI